MSTKSLSEAEYFVTFINDKTGYVWVYIIQRKSLAFKCLCKWKSFVESPTGEVRSAVRHTENGGEFISVALNNTLEMIA